MAGLGGKNWAFEEEVTSSDVNGFLADQVVMRFADAATRTAGFGGSGEPTLAEGMVSYLDDVNRVDFYNGSIWKPVSGIVQVVSTTKTDTFTATISTTPTDVTGLSATITPTSTSSKVLVLVYLDWSSPNTVSRKAFRVLRDSTVVGAGDAAGNRIPVTNTSPNDLAGGQIGIFLDTPASTSAMVYKVQIVQSDSAAVYVNRTVTDTDLNTVQRGISSITLLEVA